MYLGRCVFVAGGVFEIEDSFGVVFSTTALLQNVPRAVQAWGLSIPGEADGTYKSGMVWYGRAEAWVTNQGSVPIRRPVQDMYGCFALSNSRAKLFFF